MKKNQEYQEIDLSQSYASFKKNSRNLLYNVLIFIKRNIIPIVCIIIVGFLIGLLLDNTQKKYKSTIIVNPNFGSVDYLYEKIDLINSRIDQEDYQFLEKAGFSNTEAIKEMSVNPIKDVYSFVLQNDRNYDLFSTLTENASPNDVINDPLTSRYFKKQIIEIKTDVLIPEGDLPRLMNYINDDEYNEKIRKTIYKNIKDKISINESVIHQIDDILDNQDIEGKGTSIYIKENNDLNNLLNSKLHLVQQTHEMRTNLYYLENTITAVNYFPNLVDKTFLTGKLKFLIPIILLFLFLMIKGFLDIVNSRADELAKEG